MRKGTITVTTSWRKTGATRGEKRVYHMEYFFLSQCLSLAGECIAFSCIISELDALSQRNAVEGRQIGTWLC